MIFKRQELRQLEGSPQLVDEQLEFDLSTLKHNVLRKLEHVVVTGQINYDDYDARAYLNLLITGEMTLPESITNEDIIVPFETEVTEVISFDEKDEEDLEVLFMKNDVLDLNPLIFTNILSEIPLRVVKPGEKVYPKGNGWEVLSEEEYDNRKKPIDPRLAKLKEFKIEE